MPKRTEEVLVKTAIESLHSRGNEKILVAEDDSAWLKSNSR